MSHSDQQFHEALALHQKGDIGAAATLYRAVIDAQPKHGDAWHMLGVVAQQRGNQGLALQLMETALEHHPNLALAWHNRSLLLRGLGRNEEALMSSEKALALDDSIADAWDMTATLHREAGDIKRARECYTRALKLQPDSPRYRGNYAGLLMGEGELNVAYQLVRDAEHAPGHFGSFALGNILRATGYPGRATALYQKASAEIGGKDVIANEAMALLLIGQMKRGWELWNTLPDDNPLLADIPPWDGEVTDHLLLHEEQGMGDALQCVRYIPLIRGRARKITLRLHVALQRLMRMNFPDINVITLDDPVHDATARTQLMRLPVFCGSDLGNIPASTPYLHAADSEVAVMREKIKTVKQPRFGIVWAGNPNHRNNKNRSLELNQLRSVTDIGRGFGISLQKWSSRDTEAARAKITATLGPAHLFDADPLMNDFADTAALIKSLDLVITVDTSVAHLAGAMGKPVWVLIPFDPDWRWMLGREDNLWYPTLRLFRQSAPRDWPSAIEPLARDLARFIAGDTTVLQPKRWQKAPLDRNPLALKLPD